MCSLFADSSCCCGDSLPTDWHQGSSKAEAESRDVRMSTVPIQVVCFFMVSLPLLFSFFFFFHSWRFAWCCPEQSALHLTPRIGGVGTWAGCSKHWGHCTPRRDQSAAPPWDAPSHHHHLCAGCIIPQQGPGSPRSQGGVCPQQPCVGISRRCVISLVSDIHLLTGNLSNWFWISSLSSYEAVLEQDASIHPSTFRNKSGKLTALLLPGGSLFSTDLWLERHYPYYIILIDIQK